MMKPVLLQKQYLFYTGLFLLAAGLPVSKFLTSFSQIILLASFFLEGDLREKWRRLKSSRSAWIIAGIWLMHIVGVLYSEQSETGLWDARMKLPILVLPLLFGAAGPIPAIQVR